MQVFIGGLKCDNEKCDYENPDITLEEYPNYLESPCPKCGDSLLTKADYKALLNLLTLSNALSNQYPNLSSTNKEENIQQIELSQFETISLELNGKGEFKIKDK